jgi:hypothetical protein
MTIFVIYDSTGHVWHCALQSFQSAVNVVKLHLDTENGFAFEDGVFKDHEDRPGKMESEFTYKDEQGGVLVAYNELEKTSIFVKELTMY